MSGMSAALTALKEYILAQRAAAAGAKEQKMLQGFYRGHADAPTPVVHYHGGTYEPGAETNRPLYMSRDKRMAESYADTKWGKVVALAPTPRKTAPPRELTRLAKKYVPENAEYGYTPATALDESMHGDKVGDLVSELWNREYDSARAFDVGMDSGRGGNMGEVFIALPGENVMPAPTSPVFISPQRRIAEYYAEKRAAQTGKPPQTEMILADPFSGRAYGHSTMGSGAREPMFTQARQISPEEVKDVTDLGTMQSTDPFWYNPEGNRMARFPVTSTHTKNMMEEEYAKRLGVPPLDPMSTNEGHNALLTGRTRKSSPETLDLMRLANPDDSLVESLRALVARGDLPHAKTDVSAGESLYEGLPLSKILDARTLEDIAEWKKYARGGLARMKECSCRK